MYIPDPDPTDALGTSIAEFPRFPKAPRPPARGISATIWVALADVELRAVDMYHPMGAASTRSRVACLLRSLTRDIQQPRPPPPYFLPYHLVRGRGLNEPAVHLGHNRETLHHDNRSGTSVDSLPLWPPPCSRATRAPNCPKPPIPQANPCTGLMRTRTYPNQGGTLLSLFDE
ncbi:hypothetical protein BT67DRAFT_163684 [Trichocladium antarcticum]|uniref:Uncharacterized protein n=1 Tax=Trichocladium antarcticum TaxID=1450529 RepID=A0AAN6UDT0_9PEZI|nr:hypothetical protein BT67DRAFT_163684 [Trichocladium antarcticum]